VDGFNDAENVVAGCILSGFVTGITGPAAGARNGMVHRTTKRIVVGRGRTVGADRGGSRAMAVRNPQIGVVDSQPQPRPGTMFFLL